MTIAATAGTAAQGALHELRVLECGTEVSAPFCARLLADLGARVVKLEPPGGDPARRHGPFPGDRPDPERSGLFAWLNAGKQSVLLSGDACADAACIERLAAQADVLVTNLEPEQRKRWGLDVDGLVAAHPELVVVRLGALAEGGPLAGWRAREINVCALAAASAILGERRRPPLHFPFALPALQAGLHGAAAALAALLARRRIGLGQRVEVAEADVLAFYCAGMALFVHGSGGRWMRRGLDRHGAIYPSGFYPCKDGYLFLATQSRDQWAGFLRLMGDPAWAREDPALGDGVAIGWKRADEVDVHFIPWLAEHTRDELVEMARRESLVLGPIRAVQELLDEPHLARRGFWAEVDLDGVALRLPGMGYALSATPWRLGRPPRLGEHGDAGIFGEEEPGAERAPAALGKGSARQALDPAQGSAGAAAPTDAPARRPLHGYRAIEFGWNWAGPLVGQILADLGMEVIRVETSARLDRMRQWKHARPFFHNANRGKRSVALNVKTARGAELARRLATRADVLFDNFAAGVMARNGLGWEDLRRVNPRLIVLSMAMAGQWGPLAHLRGFATIATGFAGLELAVGYPDTGPTGFQLLGLGDANAAIQAVVACLAALWHRERAGQGQWIDLSQVEAASALVGEPLADAQWNGRACGPQGNRHPHMAPHGIYPAAGAERWVAIAVADDAEWRALVAAMGEPEWARDATLAGAAGRRVRGAALDAALAEWTGAHERDEIVARLQAGGVAATPVLGIDELAEHPYFAARGMFVEAPSFEGAPGPIYSTPWQLEATPLGVDRGSPQVGEDDGYVLGELLGLSAREIAELGEQGVVG